MSDNKKNPVGWFEIPTNDLERAKEFYEGVLGYEITIHQIGPIRMGWFPSQEGGIGAAGSLVQHEMYSPSHQGTLVYFTTSDMEDTLSKVEPCGGKIINGRTSIGEYGFVAHFEDSEGNRVALHSRN